MRRFSSVVLVDRRGHLLLQERDEHAGIDPECWGFPGGHVEAEESPDAAAHRELAEETGVRLPGGLVPVGTWTIEHRDAAAGAGPDEVHLYTAPVDLADDDVACHEGRRMVFVDPELARGLPLTVAAAVILPAYLDSAAYGSMRA